MTDTALIQALAADLKPIDPSAASRTLAASVAVGAIAAATLVASGLGVQPGLTGAAAPAFLMKLAYVAPLAALAFAGALRLGRPGVRTPSALPLLAPVALMALLALGALATHPASQAPELVMGRTWALCPLRIAAVSLPVFAAVILAMRRQAPVRRRLAGGAAGLLSGAAAAAAYALACPEASPAFILVWYSAGMAAPTALGALLGPRLLRW